MKNSSFTRFFIERPIFSTVLSLLAVLAGIFSLRSLPIAQYPDITPPTVIVSATYPGADPNLVATTIGAPIEEAINGVEGMLYMSSSSSQGSYSLTITFDVGTDIDMAAIFVQNKLNTVLNTLPASVIKQGVTVKKSSSNMLVFFGMTAKDSMYDNLYLSNYASLNVVNELARVSGVGQVQVMGAGNYSIRIWMDPEILRIRKVSASDIYTAIANQNMSSTAGSVGNPPNDNDVMFEYTLVTKGQLTDVEQFKNIIVTSTQTGEYLRLKDVARVELGSINYNMIATYMGEQTAFIAVNQLPGANALDVAKGVLSKMEDLSVYFPEGVSYLVNLNTTDFITDSIKEVIRTFFETLLIVMIVIMFFLQNWRAVLIPAITIPVSLIATFAIMAILGFSINLLTLFGLILSIAIVVDDAIVVVENAVRIMEEEKKDVKLAVEEAITELVGPIIAIDLCMLAVFVPTSFIPGITGELIKQFALTIAASTIISGFVSLTLTPALCALFLKVEPPSKFFLFRWFNTGYEKVRVVYDKAMTYLLSHVYIAMGIFVVAAGLALWKYTKLPTTFLPTEDQGYFMVMVQLPNAASLERTQEVLLDISNKMIKTMPEVEMYNTIAGFSMMGGGGSNSGTIWVILKNWSERKGKGSSAMALVQKINEEAYMGVPEATVYAMSPPSIPGLGSVGGLTLELQDRNNLGTQALYEAYLTLLNTAKEEPAVASLNSFYNPDVPQYLVNIDRDKIRMMGLTYQQVASTMAYYLGTAYVNDYVDFGRVYQVTLGGESSSRATVEDILKLSIENNKGEMVPLSSFVSFDYQTAPSSISRYNLYSSAQVNINVASDASSGTAMKQMESLINKQLGTNYGYQWTGTAYQEMQSGSSMGMIFLLAFLVVFLVLAAQYESWTSPIAVILSVPFAVLGIVLGCLAWGLPVSVYTQIGLILLIALSAKNSILIVAFARQNRMMGVPVRQASLDGGNVRLRPILMTSLAFVFGVMPLMFASGAGAESRISLGVAVVFGMAINGIFGTLFVPNFYELMQNIEENVLQKSKWNRLKAKFAAEKKADGGKMPEQMD
ncbi:MAG: efflux RND transporter permease subunit [Bacteroidales bacterium]